VTLNPFCCSMTSESVQATSATAEISAVPGLRQQSRLPTANCSSEKSNGSIEAPPTQFLCQSQISGHHGHSLEIRFATVVSQQGTKHGRKLCFNLPTCSKSKNRKHCEPPHVTKAASSPTLSATIFPAHLARTIAKSLPL